jgi:hypothetical protein
MNTNPYKYPLFPYTSFPDTVFLMDVLNIEIWLSFMQLEFATDDQVFGTFLTDLSGGYMNKSKSLASWCHKVSFSVSRKYIL